MLFIVLVSVVLLFIISRLWNGKTHSATCLIGKTALITGANSGIGYQTTLNLASRGCRVIMADVSDMEVSRQNVLKYTNNSNILALKLDLGCLKSVRDFAQYILDTEAQLDILINNAGIGTASFETTPDGLNPTMQINYFGHFLLTHLLAPLLKKSAPSRIIFTSSAFAFLNNLQLNNLNTISKRGNGTYQDLMIYSNSKFALLIASDIFSEKLKSFNVTVNSLHPGFVDSSFFNTYFSIASSKSFEIFSTLLRRMYSKDVWEGSQTILHLAVSKKLEGVSGKYFWDCKPFLKPMAAYRKGFCGEIWRRSEKLVGLRQDEQL